MDRSSHTLGKRWERREWSEGVRGREEEEEE